MSDREILRVIIERGFSHLGSIVIALHKIDETEMNKEDREATKTTLKGMYAALVDSLHPCLPIADEIFPDGETKGIVQSLMEHHKDLRDDNMFPECECDFCKEIYGKEIKNS